MFKLIKNIISLFKNGHVHKYGNWYFVSKGVWSTQNRECIICGKGQSRTY